MKTFKSFLNEDLDHIIFQLMLEDVKPTKASSDTKGKLHELLVGYHLLNEKHMSKHPDKEGDSPEEAHDKLKSKVSPEEYDKINERAKTTAHDIKKHIEVDGHSVHDVHWTSKPGDIERSTGIESSQKQDASDIVVHSKKKNGPLKFHGVSLKVSDGSSKHVPASNPGMESTHGGQFILDDHRKSILRDYPEIKNMTVDQRKKHMANNPDMNKDVRERNLITLHRIAGHLKERLDNMDPEELVHHIKKHVLQANKTPMQEMGHNHIRHTTYMSKGKNVHDSIDPSEHWEHKFKDPSKIHTKHTGVSIDFYHNGKKFASHRMKYNSQSDPLSSVKGSGTAVGD